METLFFFIKLLFLLVALFMILFFIYAMRWHVVEKQIRKTLEEEFKNKTDQALDLINRENQTVERLNKFQIDKRVEEKVEEIQNKSIESGRSQMKTEIFAELLSFIESHYTSTQTKTKLKLFCVKFKEHLKI